jgi:aspartate--ammonia ligase
VNLPPFTLWVLFSRIAAFILFNKTYISSMGIRVDAKSLRNQLVTQKHLDWENNFYHKHLLAGDFPDCIGGGIGQSRLCIIYIFSFLFSFSFSFSFSFRFVSHSSYSFDTIDMYLLQKTHIGEVLSTVWPKNTREEAKALGVHLL